MIIYSSENEKFLGGTMKKLNICIDIDGTVTDPYYFMPFFNKYFDKKLEPKDCYTCKIEDLYEVSIDKIIEFYINEGEEMHKSATVLEGVKDILWEMYEKHNLYFVTARNTKMEHITKSWMQENELPPLEVHSLGSYYKVDKAKELKCDIFIEDNPENSIQIAESGIRVFLVDTNYNKSTCHENIKRVESWYEIKHLIDEISEY